VTPCILVEFYPRLGGKYCFHFQSRWVGWGSCLQGFIIYLEDGYTTLHRNVHKFPPVYRASRVRQSVLWQKFDPVTCRIQGRTFATGTNLLVRKRVPCLLCITL
jgi:hypothetical protein